MGDAPRCGPLCTILHVHVIDFLFTPETHLTQMLAVIPSNLSKFTTFMEKVIFYPCSYSGSTLSHSWPCTIHPAVRQSLILILFMLKFTTFAV